MEMELEPSDDEVFIEAQGSRAVEAPRGRRRRLAVVEGQESAAASRSSPASSRAENRARSRRLSRLVDERGPPQVVAIVGSSGEVRWATFQRMAPGQPLFELLRLQLCVVGVPGPLIGPQPGEEEHRLLGFVLVESWHFEEGFDGEPSPHSVKELLMSTVMSECRRATGVVGILSYPILAAAALQAPLVVDIDLAKLSTPEFADDVVALVGHASLRARWAGDEYIHDVAAEAFTFGQLVARWAEAFPALTPERQRPLGWLVWEGVGNAMVRASWLFDMVPVCRSQKSLQRLDPHAPGRQVELRFVDRLALARRPAQDRGAPALSEADIVGGAPVRGIRQFRFNPVHIFNALGASSELKQVGRLQASLERHLRFAFPTDFIRIGEELLAKGFRVPSRFVLERGRIRLDVVSMVLHQQSRPRSLVSRTLTYDASPQGGQELFAAVEIVVLKDAAGAAVGALRRSQPLTQLGHGHAGVVSKAMSLVHKAALDVGFDEKAILEFFGEVRVCVTDCGTEFNVVEMPNVVKEYLSHAQGQIMEGFGVEEKGYLFPNAIRIPGWSHSHDWILKRTLTELPFWSTYLENARLLCWFLNNNSYREVFARDLKLALEGATLEELDWDPDAGTEFHANFAQWRFGTIALVARRLHAAKGALQAGFVQEHFACKDSTKLANVNRVVYDPLFWTQNFVVHILAQRSEDSRQWGLGCVCHAAECRLAARKGLRHPCWRKGLSAAFMFQQIEKCCKDWELEAVRPRLDDVGDADACMYMQQGLGRLVAWTRLRFTFCGRIPWLICAARDRTVAQQCVEQYDQQKQEWDVGRPGSFPPHRVSERFCGRGSTLLQTDFRMYASHGLMTPYLSAELLSYEYGAVDESLAEGEHRNATFQRSRARGSKFAWWAASCRLQANLDLVETCVERDGGGARLCAMWYGWKALLHPKRSSRMRLRPQRIRTKPFLEKVYLLGSQGLEDWLGVPGPLKPKAAPRTTTRTRDEDIQHALLKDFSLTAFREGCLFAFATEVDPLAASVTLIPSSSDLAPGMRGRPEVAEQPPESALVPAAAHVILTCRLFEVLESRPSSLKLALDVCSTFDAPIFVQWYRAWGYTLYDRNNPPAHLTILRDGDAVCVDGVSIAGTPAVRNSLVVYRGKRFSPVAGCVDVFDPIKFRAQLSFDGPSASIPLYELLHDLGCAGWKRADRRTPHTDVNDKRFDLPPNCVSLKLYYICLRRLPTLLDGGLPGLHTRQIVAYYDACLRCTDKSLVLPGRTAKEYKKLAGSMLTDVADGGLGHIEFDDAADGDAISEPEVDRSVAMPDAAGDDLRSRDSDTLAQRAANAGGAARAAPRLAGGDVLLSSSSSDSSSTSSNRSRSRSAHRHHGVPADTDALAPAPELQRASRGVVEGGHLHQHRLFERPVYPEFLLGVAIRLETVHPTGRPSYQRLTVVCPLSSSAHAHHRVCGTSRLLGGLCTARFGALEAAGFLGAWLERAESYANRSAHMAYKPTPSDTEAFLRRHRLLPARGAA